MGIDLGSRWVRFAAPYVLLVSSLVVTEQVTRDGRFYLAAVLLTLPFGILAVTRVYVAYGLTVQVVTLVSSGVSADRVADRTFVATGPVNVALFAAAAVGNALLLRRLVLSRAARAPR
jgi:uncharacterized membrane protein